MRVSNLFHRSVVCARTTDSLASGARLMNAARCGSVAGYDGDRLAGIFTERDLVHAIASGADPLVSLLGQHMTADPVAARLDEDSAVVAHRMLELGIRHLPVIEESRVVGMVSARDLLITEAWPEVART